MRRAIAVLMSAQGQPVRDITSWLRAARLRARCDRRVQRTGFAVPGPKRKGGGPKTIGEQIRQRIYLIARTSPADRGIIAYATWSLDHVAVVAIRRETLRRILRAGGVSWQTTTTWWKASTDPDFITKMHRVLDLYDHHPPTDVWPPGWRCPATA